MLPPLEDDRRFAQAIDHFNRGRFEDASDLMEELFFESIGDERPVARVLLQLFVGMIHVEHRQLAPALERLEVGLEAARDVRSWLSIDGAALTRDLEDLVRQVRAGGPRIGIRVRRIDEDPEQAV